MTQIESGGDHDIRKNRLDHLFDSNPQLFSQLNAYVDANTLIESYRRLQIIYGFSRALNREIDPDKLPGVVLEALIRLINLERAFVAEFDDAGKLRALAAHNIELADNPVEWPVSRTIISRVVKEGVPMLSSDASKDERFSKIHTVNLNCIRSVMCVPLGTKDSYIGIIYADHRAQTDSFSQSDLFFLTALGHYVYLAIRTARETARRSFKQSTKPSTNCAPAISAQRESMRGHNIIGRSQPLLTAYQRLLRVAEKNAPLLILGETGTGKELFAHAAHKLNGARAKRAFIAINIAALSETLVESELFGHEKGAFSNAIYSKTGKLELADGGTLFLDEVAEIPLNIQAKLLRVLETGAFERVGGTKQLHTNARLVCATNKNLAEAVQKGLFRDDLYYRIKGVTINLPPLRESLEDIPDLISHILARLGSKKCFSDAAVKSLQNYHWPGNIRQLARLVEEVDALCDSEQVNPQDLPDYLFTAPASTETGFLPLNDLVARIESDYIQRALTLAGGNNERAIELLGISRAKFFDRKKAYGL